MICAVCKAEASVNNDKSNAYWLIYDNKCGSCGNINDYLYTKKEVIVKSADEISEYRRRMANLKQRIEFI